MTWFFLLIITPEFLKIWFCAENYHLKHKNMSPHHVEASWCHIDVTPNNALYWWTGSMPTTWGYAKASCSAATTCANYEAVEKIETEETCIEDSAALMSLLENTHYSVTMRDKIVRGRCASRASAETGQLTEFCPFVSSKTVDGVCGRPMFLSFKDRVVCLKACRGQLCSVISLHAFPPHLSHR